MSIFYVVDGDDLGQAAVRLGRTGLTQVAEFGQAGMSSIEVDDPDGTTTIPALKVFEVTEGDAPSGKRVIFRGWTGKRTEERGPFETASGRVITTDLMDGNAVLAFRQFLPTTVSATRSFSRSAETDVARITAMLANPTISTELYDLGLITTTPGFLMSEADYAGQTALDVLTDCSQQSGRMFFVYWSETDGKWGLFYHPQDAPVYYADAALTNVLSEVTGNVFALQDGAKLETDPQRVISGALVSYDKGHVYKTNTQTGGDFRERDGSAPSFNVRTHKAAEERAWQYLAENSTEELRFTGSVRVPKHAVNYIKPGQLINVRATHLSLPNTSNNLRILRRTVLQDQEDDQQYRIDIEAGMEASRSNTRCDCSIGERLIGDKRPNRLLLGYPSTEDQFEAFSEDNWMTWLTGDTMVSDDYIDYTGDCGDYYGHGPGIETFQGNASSQNGGRITWRLRFAEAQTTYGYDYSAVSGPTGYFISPAFPTPPRCNIIEFVNANTGSCSTPDKPNGLNCAPTSMSLTVDGVVVCTQLAPSWQRLIDAPCTTVDGFANRFVLPYVAQGRDWQFTFYGAWRSMSIQGFLDPDDGSGQHWVAG